MRSRRLICLALTACLAPGLGACGDGGSEGPATTTVVIPAQPTSTNPAAAGGDEAGEGTTAHPEKPSGPAEGAEHDPRATELERDAAGAVRDYVAALDDRDGARACALLVPGAIDEVELPVDRGGCAASLSASIGYRDPRGLPVWDHGRVSRVRSVEIDGADAKIVATTVTRFADRGERSIEDDVVYLQRWGDRWLIAKPSSTLYRAVGIADVPPAVLTPPG